MKAATKVDDELIEDLVTLLNGPQTFIRTGLVWERAKRLRGQGFAVAALALVQAARLSREPFDLRSELRAVLQAYPSRADLRLQKISLCTGGVVVGSVATTGLWAALSKGPMMGTWAVKIVAVTGVPGLVMLVLYFFATPISQKVGLAKLGERNTGILLLVLAIGLISIAVIAILVYGAPEIIRSLRTTTAPT